ncbi:MAG: DUF3135 domain-containing protein [Deltaproteobacteria bacterium]|nr:DUF3135 domain-containing protein [Deltaproteobacteria bacterium]MBW2015785.1 DUF3135 domain-containing protein [Deltaproteobacteria bacterium]MBW2128669.1 DUF3135 domain-containing protein [Deltaproteobacteria bacterium]
MEKWNWEKEKERIREEALREHARLHKLFKEDRLSFERERKKAVEDLLNSIEDPEFRKEMREWQASWDRKMRHAGSSHNRLVLAQSFFWEHFHKAWWPAIEGFNALLNGRSKKGAS